MKLTNRTITLTLSLLLTSLALIACGGAAAEPSPTPVQGDELFNPMVSATGVIVPTQWATLSVETNGEIVELPIQMGDEVAAGDLVAALDNRASLQAAVTAARMELVSAENALEELRENAPLDRALAQEELADAQDALEDAEYRRNVWQEGNRATENTIEAAEARLTLAEEAVDRAQAAFSKVEDRPSDDPVRAQALANLTAAREERNAALVSLNWYQGSPSEIEQAQLDAEVAVAEARVREAEQRLNRLGDGPDDWALEAALARVENARAQLNAAEAALQNAELRAPFAGTVGEVLTRAHTWVTAGTPVATIGDLTELRIETTDLNEIDAARVQIGDPVTVTIDALPEFQGRGTIERVAPKASAGTGVNYTAMIEVEGLPEGARWGMTAFVDIEVNR